MKTCGFEKQINLYLDGELSGAKLRSFEDHLQQCPRCREQAGQYRCVLDALHGLEGREVPPALQDRLHAALSNEIAKGDGRVKRKVNPWALSAVAAALVIFVAVGAVALGGGNLFTARDYGNMDLSKGFTGSGAPAPDMQQSNGYAAEPSAAPMPEAPAVESKDLGKGADGRTAFVMDSVGEQAGANAQAQPGDGRKIVYTAYLVVETREYDKCMAEVESVIGKYAGYVENSQINGVPDAGDPRAGRSAVIALRMPIGKYGDAMKELGAMGNLLSSKERKDDVSRQYVDTKARMETLVKQRERYMALLDKADTTESIIALQNEITNLTVQIEQDTAQLRFWDDKVAYSTITVELRELVTPKTVKPVDPDLNSRMGGAINTTLNNMKKGLEDFTVGFAGFLPWLAVIAVAGGVLAAVLVPVARRAARAKKNAGKQ